jgi:hypothetical protein
MGCPITVGGDLLRNTISNTDADREQLLLPKPV